MLYNIKKFFIISLLLISSKSLLAAEPAVVDPIAEFIKNSQWEKLVQSVSYYKNCFWLPVLKKNKEQYIAQANNILNERYSALYPNFNRQDKFRIARGLGYLILSCGAFKCIKNAFNDDNVDQPGEMGTDEDNYSSKFANLSFTGLIGAVLSYEGLKQIYNGFNKYDRTISYQRALATRDHLINILNTLEKSEKNK